MYVSYPEMIDFYSMNRKWKYFILRLTTATRT